MERVGLGGTMYNMLQGLYYVLLLVLYAQPLNTSVLQAVCFINAEESDLSAVHSAVSSVGDRYSTLATQLGLSPNTVGVAERECPTVSERLQRILLEWLQGNYDTKLHGLPSWRLLCTAVAREAGGRDKRLASKIANQHPLTAKVHPKPTGTMHTIQCHVLYMCVYQYISPACKQ